jgi:hypothetical protein
LCCLLIWNFIEVDCYILVVVDLALSSLLVAWHLL